MPRQRPRLARTVLAACCWTALASAQATAPTEQPTSTLLIRLRARNLSLADARALVAALNERKVRDRLQANRILRGQCERRGRQFDKDAEKVLHRVATAAARVQREQLGYRGEEEVARLRAEALAVSHRQSLSKAMIQQEIDPRMTRLAELLLPDRSAIFATDARLDEALADLRRAHDELRAWHALYLATIAGLENTEDLGKHLRRYALLPEPGDRDAIERPIAFAMFAGLAMRPGDHKALLANEAIRERTPAEEYRGTLLLNRIRYELGLPLLVIDEKLSAAARDHSRDMATLQFFSHTSPVEGKRTFGQRAARFKTSAHAENIAAGQSTGEGAVRAWWYSPGHHKNMLGNHSRTGLGQHDRMWTQMFGG